MLQAKFLIFPVTRKDENVHESEVSFFTKQWSNKTVNLNKMELKHIPRCWLKNLQQKLPAASSNTYFCFFTLKKNIQHCRIRYLASNKQTSLCNRESCFRCEIFPRHDWLVKFTSLLRRQYQFFFRLGTFFRVLCVSQWILTRGWFDYTCTKILINLTTAF